MTHATAKGGFVPRPAGVLIVAIALAVLPGCVARRGGSNPATPSQEASPTVENQPVPRVAAEPPRAPATEPPATEPPAPPATNPPAPPATNPQRAARDAAAPQDPVAQAPCLPASATMTAKPKPKPKVAREKAPPQLPTAPSVLDTAPGGVVDAEVKRLPVAVMSILGKRVQGAKGEDLGRVVDVLADSSGRVRVAVVDFGGFLGVGNHRIAVDWPLLKFNPDGHDPTLLLSLSIAKVKAAPEYQENPRPQILMEPVSESAAVDAKQ